MKVCVDLTFAVQVLGFQRQKINENEQFLIFVKNAFKHVPLELNSGNLTEKRPVLLSVIKYCEE